MRACASRCLRASAPSRPVFAKMAKFFAKMAIFAVSARHCLGVGGCKAGAKGARVLARAHACASAHAPTHKRTHGVRVCAPRTHPRTRSPPRRRRSSAAPPPALQPSPTPRSPSPSPPSPPPPPPPSPPAYAEDVSPSQPGQVQRSQALETHRRPLAAGPQRPFPSFRLGNDSERKRLGNDSERKLERLGSDSERKRLENDWERFVARSCVAAEGGSNPDSEPPGATRSDSELNPSVRDGRVTLQLGAA